MYKLCKTAQSAQRQRELEYGLLEAMKTRHYDEITVSDLCARMQIPRKAFYRYFDSKDGALYGLIDHTLLEYENFSWAYAAKSNRSRHRELEQFFLFWKERKPLLDALQASMFGGLLIERAIEFALTNAVIPQRYLQEDSDRTQQHITMFAVCGLLSMVLSWHADEFSASASELAEIANRILGKPMFPVVE